MKIESVILDMDGTLWNSTRQFVDSWRVYAKEHGLPLHKTDEDFMACMGKPMDEFVTTIFSDVQREEILSHMKDLLEFENRYIEAHGAIVYPGVIESLRALAEKMPVTIVSNCQAGYIETFIRMNHLEDCITDLECFGGTGLLKADNIALIIRRNHLKNPVYVGDTQGDADAAHEAGIPIVYAAYGFGEIADAEERIDSFGEILSKCTIAGKI